MILYAYVIFFFSVMAFVSLNSLSISPLSLLSLTSPSYLPLLDSENNREILEKNKKKNLQENRK